MRIDLNTNLKVQTPRRVREKQSFLESFTDKKTDWQTKATTQTTFVSSETVTGTVYHRNYLEYLEYAYAHHYGVSLTPDIFWYTVLCEVALIISESVEKYRNLFTDSPDKKTIEVWQAGPEYHIPLDQVMAKLKELVPTNIDTFLPEFSTTVPASRFSRYAAFADAISPYYDYCVQACGLPYINLEGTKEDWQRVLQSVGKLLNLFPDESQYLGGVIVIATSIYEQLLFPSVPYMQGIFFTERCGSGSDQNLCGWWTDLFRKQPEYNIRNAANFSSHVSKVNFTFIAPGYSQKYQLNTGVMSSLLEGDLLLPKFGNVTLKVTS